MKKYLNSGSEGGGFGGGKKTKVIDKSWWGEKGKGWEVEVVEGMEKVEEVVEMVEEEVEEVKRLGVVKSRGVIVGKDKE